MNETKEDLKITGRLEDLASSPEHLRDYLAIRVDILGDEERGTIIGFGEDLREMQGLVDEDKKSETPGDEYHIFHPQKDGRTARELNTTFMSRNKFKRK